MSSTISARVARLVPAWNAENPDFDGQFGKAMALVGGEFTDVLRGYHESWLPARDIVVAAIAARASVDPSGEIIEFPGGSCPWKTHLFAIEKESEGVSIKYVLFPDSNGAYRVQCVPIDPSSFTNRKSLPEPWRGVRDQALSDLSGIPGCIFVHAGGFIGGNATRDGALEMARQALHKF